MRIMLDTNILISMALFPSSKMNALKKTICKYHQIILCSYVVDELKDVVRRKFPMRQTDVDVFLQTLPYILVYTPDYINTTIYPYIRDASDVPVLVSAILEDADILLTGDKDFSVIEIAKPEILTVTEFLGKYAE
ncbi:putative toxin-antitoxin system toxin component, PIN family [Breznakiellaceae bacterium SP9]